MTLSSFAFLLFLSVVLIVYYLVPKKLQWAVLLVGSYTFYLFSGIDHVIFIIFTTLLTFLSGLWMQKIRDKMKSDISLMGPDATKEDKREFKKQVSKKIRAIQVATVVINLGILAYVKYLNFFIGNINSLFTLFQWDISMPLVNVIVPLGLSYYTFNTTGYVVDVGRGTLNAEKHLGKFALFASFFPSIVQGPLMRYGDVGTQLKQPHDFKFKNIKYGALLLLYGFFKKLVIADHIKVISNAVFSESLPEYSGSQVLLGVLAYSVQIYCDFSGGTDITRGAAQMMGIELPLNFERPFFANSMADFWRRWHMSLGAWMREYVFYPVMLSKPVTKVSKSFRKKFGAYAGKMVPSVAAPFVVFFLIGIWHGLTWQYIINGLYNAVLISASVAMIPVFKKTAELLHINTESTWFRIFQIVRTFILFCISRVIVKAPSIGDVLPMLKAMFTPFDLGFVSLLRGLISDQSLRIQDMLMLFLAIAVLFTIDILQERGIKIRESIDNKNIVIKWAIIYILIFAILLFGVYGPRYDASAFIYGNF
ncbi:MAG: MBOAT family protein [Clostridia bacterium]|nr:MBOAT family protein [Clostridia bacterium]